MCASIIFLVVYKFNPVYNSYTPSVDFNISVCAIQKTAVFSNDMDSAPRAEPGEARSFVLDARGGRRSTNREATEGLAGDTIIYTSVF